MALAILIGLVVLIPAVHAPDCAPDTGTNASANHCSPEPKPPEVTRGESFWEWTTHDPVAFYTFILAIFTIVLAGASVVQGYLLIRAERLTRQSLDDSKKSSERQLRAYVTVKSVNLEGFQEGSVPRAIITLRNSGQTPAYEFTQWAFMGLQDFPLKDPLPENEPDTDPPRQPFGPGGEVLISTILKGPLSGEQVTAIIAGKAAIYAIGGADYIDAFGTKRRLNFCLFGNKVSGIGEGRMAAYAKGNNST